MGETVEKMSECLAWKHPIPALSLFSIALQKLTCQLVQLQLQVKQFGVWLPGNICSSWELFKMVQLSDNKSPLLDDSTVQC